MNATEQTTKPRIFNPGTFGQLGSESALPSGVGIAYVGLVFPYSKGKYLIDPVIGIGSCKAQVNNTLTRFPNRATAKDFPVVFAFNSIYVKNLDNVVKLLHELEERLGIKERTTVENIQNSSTTTAYMFHAPNMFGQSYTLFSMYLFIVRLSITIIDQMKGNSPLDWLLNDYGKNANVLNGNFVGDGYYWIGYTDAEYRKYFINGMGYEYPDKDKDLSVVGIRNKVQKLIDNGIHLAELNAPITNITTPYGIGIVSTPITHFKEKAK